ncbi:hypothetical protein EON64_05865 [archaeon]|nr:MAG: hypothetical protein EON64_05865 [archaeon]
MPHTFKSQRCLQARFSKPNKISVFKERSCASSSIMTAYRINNGSERHSRMRIPSVINLILVAEEVLSSNLTV